LPTDSLDNELDVAMATVARTVTTNGTVPSATLGTVPSNDTVVSNDTVLCSNEMALDISSQSVEIITSEESHLLQLDLQATGGVTSHDLDPDTEGQFMTAKFYIGDSLPESPISGSTLTTRQVLGHCHCLSVCLSVSSPRPHPLSWGCDFMMGLDKPKQHAKFKVTSSSHCRNITGEFQNFEELP